MTTEIDSAASSPPLPSDAELLTAVAAGDDQAYGVLWSRHEGAARRFAAQLTRPSNVEDLVSESFARVLRAVKDGGGPESAFRAYLFNTMRRFNIDTGRSYHQRVALTGEDALLDVRHADSAADELALDAEHQAAWRAWESLPEDSRTLLWHLIIEEETPAQIAPLLGVTPNGVSSRAVRAKERLRQAFLSQHLASTEDESCRSSRSLLGGYVRDALSTRDHDKVDLHIRDCHRCAAAVLEIRDVNNTMRLVIAPIVLGGSAIAGKYLVATSSVAGTASTAGTAPAGGPLRTLNRMRHSVPTGPATMIVAACVAAACAITSAVGAAVLLVSEPSASSAMANGQIPADYSTTVIGPASSASPPTSPSSPPVSSPSAVPVVPAPGVPSVLVSPTPTPTIRSSFPAPSRTPLPSATVPTVTPSSTAPPSSAAPSSTAPGSTAPSTTPTPTAPPTTEPPAPATVNFTFPLPGPELITHVTVTLPQGWTIVSFTMLAALLSIPDPQPVSVWDVLGINMSFEVTGPSDPLLSATVVMETIEGSQTVMIPLT